MTISVYSTGGPRPSAEDVQIALEWLDWVGAHTGNPDLATISAVAVDTLRAASEPRPVWPAKETAAALGVEPANLGDIRGLPEPAQVLPRPTVVHPDKVMRLWYADEIEAFAKEWRARRAPKSTRNREEES